MGSFSLVLANKITDFPTLFLGTSTLPLKKQVRTISVCELSCSVAQSCPTLCDPTDYSLPGSPVHGIFQARILSELPFPAPGDLPDSRIKPAFGGLSL